MRHHVPKVVRKRMGILLSAIAVVATVTIPSRAYAIDTHKLVFDYTIKNNYTGGETPVEGLRFTVYEVNPDQFEKNDCVFVEMKKGFEDHLGNKVCEISTNEEGKATVDLKNGTYVAVPSKNDRYTFLPIGLHINENVDTVITLNPKVSMNEKPEEENLPSRGKEPPAKTDDPTDMAKVAILALFSGFVLIDHFRTRKELNR